MKKMIHARLFVDLLSVLQQCSSCTIFKLSTVSQDQIHDQIIICYYYDITTPVFNFKVNSCTEGQTADYINL